MAEKYRQKAYFTYMSQQQNEAGSLNTRQEKLNAESFLL